VAKARIREVRTAIRFCMGISLWAINNMGNQQSPIGTQQDPSPDRLP
jgi:hypothetical protein